MHINRTLRLDESETIAGRAHRTGIAIHHTVGGSVPSTVAHWRGDKTPKGKSRRVGTAYLIERDGTVFEVFDPETAWAFQFGLDWEPLKRLAFEQRFIGIELASEGALTERDGHLYAFGVIAPRTRVQPEAAFDHGEPYRGYRWFDRYEPAQRESLGALVDHLCERFAIPRRYPEHPFSYYGQQLAMFEGVIGHAMVREDKSDPAPDPGLWTLLEQQARLVPTAVTPPGPKPRIRPLSQRDQDQLFQENAQRLNRLETQAGSIVKALLMELERRKVFLELGDPEQSGAHAIPYTIVRGDDVVVARIGRVLGFTTAHDGQLEVRHA